tara:strand:- start:240 stop:431 length:192 start_codon:yes stop_codon:yes gene_type:complete
VDGGRPVEDAPLADVLDGLAAKKTKGVHKGLDTVVKMKDGRLALVIMRNVIWILEYTSNKVNR